MDSKSFLRVYEKGDHRVVHEYYSSIHQMLLCFSERKNNSVMENKNSSATGGKSFTGTESYEEAEKLLREGYTDILEDIKVGIHKTLRRADVGEIQKSQIINDVHGAVPNIPNYLAGIPQNMTYRKPSVRKVKTINIVYAPTENCGTDTEEFIKAGVAILSAIRVLEKQGISVKLDCMFMDAEKGDEIAYAVVRVKNYYDRLDLQKLCFPLAHPSMLRRMGFKFLETVPEIKEDFTSGYGHTPDLDVVKKTFQVSDNAVIINLRTVLGKLEGDVVKILEYINKNLNKK